MEEHSHMEHSSHKMSNMDHSGVHNIVHGVHQTNVNETGFLNNFNVSLKKSSICTEFYKNTLFFYFFTF